MIDFLPTPTSTINKEKNTGMILMLIVSQIINLKITTGVSGLTMSYQRGGETLVPVVKHCVSDSTVEIPLTFLLHSPHVVFSRIHPWVLFLCES